MLEHNEHDKTKKESSHSELRVNGKLSCKNRSAASLQKLAAFNGLMPTSTKINYLQMTSKQNAPKRLIEAHTILSNFHFGGIVIRATVHSEIYSQNSISNNNIRDLAKFWDPGPTEKRSAWALP